MGARRVGTLRGDFCKNDPGLGTGRSSFEEMGIGGDRGCNSEHF